MMRWNRVLGYVAVLALLVLPGAYGQESEIVGALSNFDVHQGCFESADNFELDFFGPIDPEDFDGFFPGWGAPPRFDDIKVGGADLGAEVLWLDRAGAVPFCQWRHFGIMADPALPPMGVQAYWTRIKKVVQFPVPFQWWVLEGDVMIDVVAFSPTFDQGPVRILREWAVSPAPIPLEQLQFETTPVAWTFGDEFVMSPGDMRELMIPMPPMFQAALVRYSVVLLETGGVVTRFVTEAVRPPLGPVIESVLVNFDLHNTIPGAAFDNVELDFFGEWLDPSMVRWWYDVEDAPGVIPAWGVDPLIRLFPAGFFPGLPAGMEVTWLDKFDPFEFCETFHFGLEFAPSVMPAPWIFPSVQAYWTQIDTCQVPVPWQFWQPLPGGPIEDIILLSDTWTGGPAEIDRQVATLPFEIPLPDLTWDGTEDLPWMPVAGDPIVLDPGGEARVAIPLGEGDQAALVRYTVRPLAAQEVETRFVNEALVIPYVSDAREGAPELWGTRLEQNAPNPFASSTVIPYALAAAGDVKISVYDVAGRCVAVLYEGTKPAGTYAVRWAVDGKDLPAGTYLAVLEAAGRRYERKMVLVN